MRLARNNYKYHGISDLSVISKALPFDHNYFNARAEFPRTSPSSDAVLAMAEETIVYLTTCSNAASQCIKNLKVGFDIVIVDEAGQVAEEECLIQLVVSIRNTLKRSHLVLVGYVCQSAPIMSCEHPVLQYCVTTNRVGYRPKFKDQIMSLFERLPKGRRCAISWLRHQYRSHPHIGRIQTPPIYGDTVQHPESKEGYITGYNNVTSSDHAFQPFTFIDTRKCHDRTETSTGMGDYTNKFECDQIGLILERLFKKCEKETYRGQSFITSPYRSQVEYLETQLNASGQALDVSQGNENIDIVFATVDGL